jgi:hypothetical protein
VRLIVTHSAFHSARLSKADQSRLLSSLLERARSARARGGARPVFVFDLDGTLMDNRPRVVAILRELADAWTSRHPEAAECCRKAQPDDIVYGFTDNLRRLGVSNAELHDAGLRFWKDRFFGDAFQRHDVAVKGAREYVHACWETGAIIVYLTGRDLPGMALGTFASLRDLGFPIGRVGTELVVKPTFEEPDTTFKRGVAPELGRLGEVIGVFDNEPANCNLLLEAHPECASVLLDTQHAPDPPSLLAGVHVVRSFARDE